MIENIFSYPISVHFLLVPYTNSLISPFSSRFRFSNSMLTLGEGGGRDPTCRRCFENRTIARRSLISQANSLRSEQFGSRSNRSILFVYIIPTRPWWTISFGRRFLPGWNERSAHRADEPNRSYGNWRAPSPPGVLIRRLRRRTTGRSQELFARERDEHQIHGTVQTWLRRRTSAAARVHSGHQRAAVRGRGQLQRFRRAHGHRSDRIATVHPVRGHGVRNEREGPEPEPRARLRRDRAQPEGSTRGRLVHIFGYTVQGTSLCGVPGTFVESESRRTAARFSGSRPSQKPSRR